MTRTTKTLGLLAALFASVIGVAVHIIRARAPRPPSRLEQVVQTVPNAKRVFEFRGTGFAQRTRSFQSDDKGTEAVPKSVVIAHAPAQADGAFEVTRPGSKAKLRLSALNASPRARGNLDRGAVVFAEAYPGVDLITLRDPERFELAYYVKAPGAQVTLGLDVTLEGTRGTLQSEANGRTVLAREDDGRPLYRLMPPVAIDSRGSVRQGRYEVHGSHVSIKLDWSGLIAPVVVDPDVVLPTWSLTSDVRTPGAVVYDPASGSREVRLVMDDAVHQPILLRPSRSQQREDSLVRMGDLNFQPAYTQIVPTPRLNGVSQTPAELADWERTAFGETETWSWSNNAWTLKDIAGLPGIIDPAVAFDPTRNVVVLLSSGASWDCTWAFQWLVDVAQNWAWCGAGAAPITYEFTGSSWVWKQFYPSPPPRMRAALGQFRDKMVLFGGRRFETRKTVRGREYGPMYPDNFAAEPLNDTWTYDGTKWELVATSNPPPARENAQLVFDARRGVTVLVGGATSTDGDLLSIWEFDGTDWIKRVDQDTPNLPRSLKGRRSMAAFWHPVRQTTVIFGGAVDVLDSCPLEGDDLQSAQANAGRDPTLKAQLYAQGCMPGYAHDSWEWDGANLRQLTSASFGGLDGDQPIYQQVSGAKSWQVSPPQPTMVQHQGSSSTALLPWRIDPRVVHFALRSNLERAFADPAVQDAQRDAPPTSMTTSGTGTSAPAIVSPLFGGTTRPEIAFDAQTGKLLVYQLGAGRIFQTDGSTWAEVTPESSPFARGARDFYAVAWDSTHQRAILFDPSTAATWSYADSTGWTRLQPTASPSTWGLAPGIRMERDVEASQKLLESNSVLTVSDFEAVAKRAPRMTYDRTRDRMVMLYSGQTWEFDGTQWYPAGVPPGWTSCTAATLLAADGTRGRTVAVGCRVPGETWEWDGTRWAGPFAGPYQSLVDRQTEALNGGGADLYEWTGTLQLGWAHPNSIFEAPSLGGIATFDADGSLRVWNGQNWTPGPRLPDGFKCDMTESLLKFGSSQALPLHMLHLFNRDFVPTCFFPPAIEDFAHGRLLALLDSAAGQRELRLSVPSAERKWQPVALGSYSQPELPNGAIVIENPYFPHIGRTTHLHPAELLSPEHVYLVSQTDPNSRVYPIDPKIYTDYQPPQLPSQAWRVQERRINNLFWPFRILADPVAKRIRILTDRGAVWELGGEVLKGLGDPCQSGAECGEGYCTREGVCCDDSECSSHPCTTCKGSKPGVCELVPAGQPEPHGYCGTGVCAGVCSGKDASCTFDGSRPCGPLSTCSNGIYTPGGTCGGGCTVATQPVPCLGGLACADATSCRTTCDSRTDCAHHWMQCNANANGCQPDSTATHATQAGIPLVDFTPKPLTPTDPNNTKLEEVEPGVWALPYVAGGMRLAIDTRNPTPGNGLEWCAYWIKACMLTDASTDSCVASAPRCVGDEPWKNLDQQPCCPAACLDTYLESRQTKNEADSLVDIAYSGCYPGIPARQQVTK